MENKDTSQPCISVSLTGLGLFKTLEDAISGLDRVARLVEDEQNRIEDE